MSKRKSVDQFVYECSSCLYTAGSGDTAYGESTEFMVMGLRLGRKILLTTYQYTRQSYGRWNDEEVGFGVLERSLVAAEAAPGEVARLAGEKGDVDEGVGLKVVELADSAQRLGRRLDGWYAPTEGVAPAKPSRLLREAFTLDTACEEAAWAWFDGALHLTAYRFVRGYMNPRAQFDEGLEAIAGSLGLRTVKVVLRPEAQGEGFIGKVRFSILEDRRARLSMEISRRHGEIERSRNLIKKYDLEIAARKGELGAVDERLRAILFPGRPS